jgi:ATP-dependent DNA helicase RecG
MQSRLLPVGVTPQNILHKSVRRNEKLSQVFYDLILMEREGSGYDVVYEELLTNGKQIPQIVVGDDSVKAIVKKQIAKPEVISFLNRMNSTYQLRQKEAITLGLIAQYNTISALDLSQLLEFQNDENLRTWIGRLKGLNIIISIDKTKATKYAINPKILKHTNFKGKTNLKRIESHRLKELIYQDLLIYAPCSISEIHERIGKEISKSQLIRCLKLMVENKTLSTTGERRWTKYSINQKNVQ